jgi:hypothetical protein
MALFDSQYSLDQAYNNPVVQQPLASPTPLSPFNSGGDPSFGKTLMGQSALDDSYLRYGPQQQFPEQQLGQYQSSIYGNPLNQQPSSTQSDGNPGLGKTLGGLSSLMGQQPPAMMPPSQRIDRGGGAGSMMPFPEQQLNQYQSAIYGNPLNQQPSYTQTDIESGDPGLGKTMLGIGSGMMGQQLQPFEEQIAQPPELSPPIMSQPVQPTMPSPIMSQPVQPTMPSATPMPGDVGYVPYGSSNNQPLVQGLAGGGPIRNLSFVELLRQTMEN